MKAHPRERTTRGERGRTPFRVGGRQDDRHIRLDTQPPVTRLPGYARGRCGRVALLHGTWVFPDTHAHGAGENPQHVYAVRFEARELWGEQAEAGTCIHVDLFESYLAPAESLHE